MEFKDLVKFKRLEGKLTMEDVAKAVGVSKATVQRWESGEIENIRRDKILKLANVLNTTPSKLLGLEEKSETTSLSKTDNEIVSLFNQLTDSQKKQVSSFIKFLKDNK